MDIGGQLTVYPTVSEAILEVMNGSLSELMTGQGSKNGSQGIFQA